MATEGDATSVMLVTELPKVTALVVSGVPVAPPPTLANGAIVILLEDEPGGLVPVPVIVTVALAGIDELRPSVTTLQPVRTGGAVEGEQLLAPETVALLTVAAVPPEGVYVTVKAPVPLFDHEIVGGDAVQVREQLAVSTSEAVPAVRPPLAAPNWVIVYTVFAPELVLATERTGGVEVLVMLLDETNVALADVETPRV